MERRFKVRQRFEIWIDSEILDWIEENGSAKELSGKVDENESLNQIIRTAFNERGLIHANHVAFWRDKTDRIRRLATGLVLKYAKVNQLNTQLNAQMSKVMLELETYKMLHMTEEEFTEREERYKAHLESRHGVYDISKELDRLKAENEALRTALFMLQVPGNEQTCDAPSGSEVLPVDANPQGDSDDPSQATAPE